MKHKITGIYSSQKERCLICDDFIEPEICAKYENCCERCYINDLIMRYTG